MRLLTRKELSDCWKQASREDNQLAMKLLEHIEVRERELQHVKPLLNSRRGKHDDDLG